MGRCVPAVGHNAVVLYTAGLLRSLLWNIDLPPRHDVVLMLETSEAALRQKSPS
jgi:hypothetical protein